MRLLGAPFVGDAEAYGGAGRRGGGGGASGHEGVGEAILYRLAKVIGRVIGRFAGGWEGGR
eukprot:CAMPEP_0197561468 /NCGR_PEP_ID=MMETSP1320-20131121/25234_1 /TAXON_ID=91990 /ORGANISM="Bolidomonas sp., Strain RCC2347" /LENGTH=60 /DNA_ID=CAMNT_0043123113 /DNA_START=258 /DNA_END=440 /DNA_ORIENTATION=-